MPKLYAIREFVWPIWILQSIFKNALCNCHSFIRIFFLIFWTSEFCKWMEASIEREQRYRILSSQSQLAENTYLLYVALKQLILVRSIRYAIHNLFIYLCNCHSFIKKKKKKIICHSWRFDCLITYYQNFRIIDAHQWYGFEFHIRFSIESFVPLRLDFSYWRNKYVHVSAYSLINPKICGLIRLVDAKYWLGLASKWFILVHLKYIFKFDMYYYCILDVIVILQV